MNKMSLDQINQYILYKQHLSNESKTDDIYQVVKDIIGLHAQVPTSPYLSLFARTRNFTKEKLEEELYVKKTLAKIKCIRQTIFILPKELIAPAFAATKKMFEISSDRYPKHFGITEEEYIKTSKTIIEIIQDHGLTTKEIKKNFESSANLSLVINHMCDQGLLIRGKPQSGWKNNIHNYHSLTNFLSDVNLYAIDESSSRTLITELYIDTFGPVCEKDIAWWTGFPKREIKQIIENLKDQLVHMQISGVAGDYIISKLDEKKLETFRSSKEPVVNFLPVLDPYIMGFKERQRFIDENYYNNVFDFNGNATSTILLNGRIIGVWNISSKKESVIKIHLFHNKLDDRILNEISSMALKTGNFITEEKVEIHMCDSMTTLTQRTAGGYQSPLKNLSSMK